MTEILYAVGGLLVGVLSTILYIMVWARIEENAAFRRFWMP